MGEGIEEIEALNKIFVLNFINPSIVRDQDKYIILFRHWGKTHSTVFSGYLKDTGDKIFDIKKENFDLGVGAGKCLGHNGIEDSRVFKHNDKIYALSTMRDSECNFGIYVLDISQHTIQAIKPMFDYSNKWVKNWTPFIIKDNIQLFCSSIDPLIITEIKDNRARIKYISSNKELYDMGDKTPYFFRGSAGVIKTKIGYIGSCHYVLNSNNYQKRQYINILFMIQDTPPYNITKISKKFCFNKKNNINFLSGMETDSNDNIIFTVGIEDKDSLICTVDINTIIDMFNTYRFTRKNPIDNSSMDWEDSQYTKLNFPGPDYEIGEKQEIFKLVLKNKPNYGVVDVGAHIGDLAIPLAQALSNAGRSDIIVYAIDPSRDKCEFMNKIIKYNKLTNIIVINTGLSDENKLLAHDKYTDKNTGGFIWRENGSENTSKTSFVTLDSLLENGTIRGPIGFYHIDVETHELEVINGSKIILNKDKPLISIEIFDKNVKSCEPDSSDTYCNLVFNLLKKLSYKYIKTMPNKDLLFQHLES